MATLLDNPTFKPFIIAVDGYSSCGKSTLAKALAQSFHLKYIDSGAMYRAVTLYMLKNDLSLADIASHLNEININFKSSKKGDRITLNDIDIEDEIRLPAVSQQVSEVSTLSEVRSFLVLQQRVLGKDKNIIMDGRDIGTVVFPNAEVKLFITASSEIRAKRRYLEYQKKGIPSTFEEVLSNIKHRDQIDSTRSHSPLFRASDAVIIDNTEMNEAEQLQCAIDIIVQKISTLN